MNEEEKSALREKIIAELDVLGRTIEKLKEASKPVAPDNSLGRLTRMEAISAKGVSEASLANARGRKNNLKLALTKLDDQDFGLCAECEEEIPLKRIMFLPESILCVKCAGSKV